MECTSHQFKRSLWQYLRKLIKSCSVLRSQPEAWILLHTFTFLKAAFQTSKYFSEMLQSNWFTPLACAIGRATRSSEGLAIVENTPVLIIRLIFFPRSDWWLKCDNLLLLRARGQKLWLGYVFMQTMQRVHEMRNQIGALTKFYRSRESSSLKNSRKVSKVRVKEVEQPWNCSTLLFMFLGLRTLHLHREVFSLKGN